MIYLEIREMAAYAICKFITGIIGLDFGICIL